MEEGWWKERKRTPYHIKSLLKTLNVFSLTHTGEDTETQDHLHGSGYCGGSFVARHHHRLCVQLLEPAERVERKEG